MTTFRKLLIFVTEHFEPQIELLDAIQSSYLDDVGRWTSEWLKGGGERFWCMISMIKIKTSESQPFVYDGKSHCINSKLLPRSCILESKYLLLQDIKGV